jgi:hypothetical protein
MKPGWVVVACATAVMHIATAGSSQAAAADIGTLGASGTQKIVFSNHFENPLFPYAPGALIPELCSVAICHEYEVTVDGSVAPQDVAMAIGWIGEDQQSDLYVYGPNDDAQLAASSTGIASQGQSLVLRSPAAGVYRIVVAGSRISSLDYSGIAQVQNPIPQAPPGVDLLPALITPPPRDFHVLGLPLIPSIPLGFVIPSDLLPPAPPTGTPLDSIVNGSCYLDEILDAGGDPTQPHRCLRFSNDIANVGSGPLEIQFHLDPLSPGLCVVEQVVHRSDGSTRRKPIADGCELHPSHLHVHFKGFATYQLFGYDPTRPPAYRSSEPVGVGRKVGFCVTDVDPESVSTRYDGATVQPIQPRNYRFPNCNLPSRIDDHGLENVMGVTPGWGDVYTWDLPDQFIEITGLAPGKYDVVSIANPTGSLDLEPSSREGHQWVCLTADAVSAIESNDPGSSCP